MSRFNHYSILVLGALVFLSSCGYNEDDRDTIKLVAVGQALIKADPRITWDDPFGSIRPLVEAADVAFTNFEMAVNGPGNECGVPEGYITVLGEPRIGPEDQPGNTSWPHAVDRSVMEFLAWWGLLANFTIRDGFVDSIEMIPLELYEGGEYFDKYNTADFLTRRGLSEVATGDLASEILERFRSLSARYGAEVKIRGDRAFIEISGND